MDQSDFRRLISELAANKAEAPKTVATAGSSAAGSHEAPGTSTAAKPKKDKSRFFRPKNVTKPKAEEDEAAQLASAYRDRAAERRQTDDNMQAEEILLQNIDYERSKYLGGDLAHTHLVKGLDFALLKKMREELAVAPGPAATSEPAQAQPAPAPRGTEKRTEEQQPKVSSKAASILAAVKALQTQPRLLNPGRKSFSPLEIGRALEGKPLNGDERFLPGRLVFEIALDPAAEIEPIPTIIMRSRQDAPAHEPAIIDPGVDSEIMPHIVALSLGKPFRHRQAQPSKGTKPARAVENKEAAAQLLHRGQPGKPAATAPSPAGAAQVDDDDDDDIFVGAGRYELPDTGGSGNADMDTKHMEDFAAIPHGAGGFLSGTHTDMAGDEAGVPSEGTSHATERTSAPHGTVAPTPPDSESEDDDRALMLSRSTKLAPVAVDDFTDEAFESGAKAPQGETRLEGLAGLRSVAKMSNAKDAAGVAGIKRPRPETTAPSSTSAFAALGGDTGPLAGKAAPKKTGHPASRLENYERKVGKSGSWLSALQDKDEDAGQERSRKKAKMENDLQKIQQLMEERRSGAVKGIVAGFGGGAKGDTAT